MKWRILPILFLLPTLLAGQAPTAGFEILRAYLPTGSSGPPPYWLLEMQGFAYGNPTTVSYTAYNIIMQVQGTTTSTATGVATIFLNSNFGGTFYVRQIVSNAMGADTLWDTIPNVSCTSTVNPRKFDGIRFRINNGTATYAVGNNYNTVNADVSINRIGGGFSNFHSQIFWGSSVLPGPGQYRVCGQTNYSSCPLTTVCDTFAITCLTTQLEANFSQSRVLNTVTFTDLSIHSAPILAWDWDFGDGTSSNQQSPVHTYATPGYYTATLRITDQCGQSQFFMPVNATCYKPWAQFTTSGSTQAVSFTNRSFSQSPITGTLWDFGNGATSTATSPTYTYPIPGLYNVCLITSNGCGSDTICKPVVVGCITPTAAFSSSNVQLNANFSTNILGATSYAWDFGDGGSSTLPSPSHTYPASGTYNVCLIATSGCGADTLCQAVTINCPIPSASYNPSSNLLNGSFLNTSPNTLPTTWSWNFGDPSSAQNTASTYHATHLFSGAGTYNVCLIASSVCGADTACQTVTINCPSPASAFSSTASNLSVLFSNQSTGTGATTYAWSFGDGGTSTQTAPSHTYAAPGTYNVCLITSTPCGSDTTCQPLTVACPVPATGFSAIPSQLTATFANATTSSTPATYAWTFGDGNTSTAASPTHAYATPGTYTVCLVAANSCGADTLCQALTVSCAVPTAAFSTLTNVFTTTFSNASTASSGATYTWDFGDGGTSTQASPLHTYAGAGTYTVCLIVSDLCGADTSCQTLTVLCATPQTSFGATTNQLSVTFINNTPGTGITYAWDFGDGNSSTQAAPAHTYATGGQYIVCLVATNACGADTLCQVLNVTGTDVPPSILPSLVIYPNPATEDITIAVAELPAGPCTVRITDLRGATLSERTELHRGGAFRQVMALPVAAGTYLVSVSGTGLEATRRVVKVAD